MMIRSEPIDFRPLVRGVLALAVCSSLALAQSWEMRVCADPDNLPNSHRTLQGFDNRILALLAQDLKAKLTYVWWPQGPSIIKDQLRQGNCDVVVGVGESYRGVLSTLAYYQSTYVFVYRADSPYKIVSVDDEVLKTLRIAIETPGTPPFASLVNRGLSQGAMILEPIDPNNTSSSPMLEAVSANKVDVAILWGPVAAYFAKRQPVKMTITPVSPEFEPPALSMVYAITLGVRVGDEAFKDRLNRAITRRWDQIQAILKEFGVPQIPLPKPVLEVK
ncbi:MAG: quinoprotein dehydrogenase-associated putative ABC transporter substrate-binding protein [Meiothermus sp.]|nr:quinoprotein dehydrogenase-associated putative ABC transporter substrate-binding protein [Meiothermus sp.]